MGRACQRLCRTDPVVDVVATALNTCRMVATRFQIDGMHCAACVARIEKSLAQVPGVTSAQVNLATREGRVESAAELPVPSLREAVERALTGMAEHMVNTGHAAGCQR